MFRDGVLIGTVGADTTTYRGLDLLQGRAYAYSVRAVDSAGNTGGASAPASVDVADTVVPDVPAQVTAVAQDVLGGVYLSWDASRDNVGIVGYDVYRDGDLLTTVSTPGYLDAPVPQGATHDYAVAALDAAGNRAPDPWCSM